MTTTDEPPASAPRPSTHPDECTCPYASVSPHRREHCRYAEDNEQ